MVAASPSLDARGLLVLVLDAVILTVVVMRSFDRSYDKSDHGSGSVVMMTPPLRPSYKRCLLFILSSFGVSTFLVGLKTPDPTHVYSWLVTRFLLSAVHDPVSVSSYGSSLRPIFQLTLVAFVLAFAIAFASSLLRRLAILANAVLFLLVCVLIDTTVGLVVLEWHIPLGPTPLVNLLLQYAVGGILLIRLSFTSFQLPKMTPIPLHRGHDWKNDLLLLACAGAAATVTAFGATLVVSRLGSDQLVLTIVVLSFPVYLFTLTTLFLGVIRLTARRKVDPGRERPPIDVIVPAFNEESVIERMLKSVDRAAGRYEGPLRVILADDGSSDNTAFVAERVISAFAHAQGEIIPGNRRGKSAALNEALSRCTSEIVFRMDADCEAHPDCFLYAVPYFLADPEVGLVSAINLPKEPYHSWIDRMRLFEVITLFGLIRPASEVVDGIFCVPGTFTGFRRQPALDIGGFIEGMYGEDVEFTYSVARLGYRVVIDTRIVCYEDVPNTQRQLRVQRTRWNRGGTMAFARHVPVVTGLAGPRMWFFATRQAVRRAIMPFKLTLLTYILALAVLDPSSHQNLARLVAVVILRFAPSAIETIAFSVYYRKGRQLIWLPLQFVFHLLKLYYALEAWLSFNARPVLPPVRVGDAVSLPPLASAPTPSAGQLLSGAPR